MKQRMEKIENIARECANKLKMEIISVEFVVEHGMKILRIIARKEPTLTIDDSSDLNRAISNELDKVDLIKEEYYLEVSSEGVERELKTDEDIKQAVGEYVCIGLFVKLDGKKEVFGDLVSFQNDELKLEFKNKSIKKELIIKKDKIAKIRLAVRF